MTIDLDILAMGEALIEFNQTDPSQQNYRFGFGGDTSNCVIAAARQGAKAGYLSAIGDDHFGAALRELWQAEGIDQRFIKIDPSAPTGLYFVHHDETGHHFSYRRAGSAASLLGPNDLSNGAIEAAKLLQLSGISLAISGQAADAAFGAMAQAQSLGRLVAFDTNYRSSLWPLDRAQAVILAAARQADIVLPGLDDAKLLTGLSAPQAILDYFLHAGAKIVALTMGAEGCWLADQHDRKHLAPHTVKAVDATGAGDTFDGAFLAEYLRTNDWHKAGIYANAAAALATTGFGAVAPIPNRAQVEAFLAG